MNVKCDEVRDNCVGSDMETHGVRVIVEPRYAGHRRDEHGPKHVFAYHVTIQNQADKPARLRSRHWIVVDGDGHRFEVRGSGVMGEFPRLEPGQSHQYVSECPLSTTWGTMEGSYEFESDSGERFSATIGRFYLALRPR